MVGRVGAGSSRCLTENARYNKSSQAASVDKHGVASASEVSIRGYTALIWLQR